jgi:hypothetical protein
MPRSTAPSFPGATASWWRAEPFGVTRGDIAVPVDEETAERAGATRVLFERVAVRSGVDTASA